MVGDNCKLAEERLEASFLGVIGTSAPRREVVDVRRVSEGEGSEAL